MEDELYPLDDNVLKLNHSGWYVYLELKMLWIALTLFLNFNRMVIEPDTVSTNNTTFSTPQSWTPPHSKSALHSSSVLKLFVQRHCPSRFGHAMSLYEYGQTMLPYMGLAKGSTNASHVMKFIHRSFTSCEMAFEQEIIAALRKLTCEDEFDFLELFDE